MSHPPLPNTNRILLCIITACLCSLSFVTLPAAETLVNLAENKCDSAHSYNYPDPCNAFDADLNTGSGHGIHFAGTLGTPMLAADFGKTETITKVVLYYRWPSDGTHGWEILSSPDGTNWTSIRTCPAAGAVDSQLNLNATCRYMKVGVAMTPYNDGSWSLDIAEVQMWGLGTPVQTNYLDRTGWTASAIRSNLGELPGKAIDNNKSTRWSVGEVAAVGHWFALDMKSPKSIVGLNIVSTKLEDLQGYSVFLSNNGQDWGNAVASGMGGTDQIAITFPEQSARYIRILQTSVPANHQKWWAISEIYVVGGTNPVALLSRPTGTAKPSSDQMSNRLFFSVNGRKINASAPHPRGLGLYLGRNTKGGTSTLKPQLMVR